MQPESSPTSAGWEKIADEAKLSGPARDRFKAQAARLRTYLGLREAAKHYLLMGYAVIRRALVELDRRFGLNGGIFFLTPADLPDLLAGKDLTGKVAAARKRRQTELSLEVPLADLEGLLLLGGVQVLPDLRARLVGDGLGQPVP